MVDKKVTDSIDRPTREEHELFERQLPDTTTRVDRERLQRIQIMRDQCWGRRTRREFGLNADEARLRGGKTVEDYSG